LRRADANAGIANPNPDTDTGNANANALAYAWWRMPDGDHTIDEPNDNEWQLSLVQWRFTWVLPC
jgi:hypothetical protein